MPISKTKFHPRGTTPPPNWPDGLLQNGPVVAVQLEVSSALGKRLGDEGKPIPQPITGTGLIDTGATFSAIDTSIAAKLGLEPTGLVKVGTAKGAHEAPIYSLKITLPSALVQVEDSYVTGVELADTPYIALLGRSFLRSGILIYDGWSGEFSFAV